MGVPYEIQPMSGLVVPGGQSRFFRVPFPNRSFISKVVVHQYAGTLVNFTVEIYNNAAAETPADEASDSVGPEVGPIPVRCFLIGPTLSSSAAGRLEYFSDAATGGHGLCFVSTEKDVPGRSGRMTGKCLYVKITAEGAGEKAFALSVGGESQVGD